MMADFKSLFGTLNWDYIASQIYSTTKDEVESALSRVGNLHFEDFLTLVSPQASNYLEEMSAASHSLTRRRFGNTIQLYIPMYLSNECQNICNYCGFSFHNKVPRITLSKNQILKEIDIIKSYGFDHILILTGESSQVGMEYFESVLPIFREYFSNIAIEVQPLDQSEYSRLIELGVSTVLVYQETYNEAQYRKHHLKGKKANFEYRLDTPDRLGRAGIHKIGIGCLLGLEDWRVDSSVVAFHLSYLRKRYWRTKYSISFPRLRPAEGVVAPKVHVSDRDLVQLICAYRLFDENVELSLSTRESPQFRDNVLCLGITSASAGSKTNPGGYGSESDSLEQFEINDNRTPSQFSQAVISKGLHPVWKDWERTFGATSI